MFHGFVRVLLNIIRPVHMSMPSQPASACDVTVTSRVEEDKVTTFHLPKDTTKVIHITRYVVNTTVENYTNLSSAMNSTLFFCVTFGDSGVGQITKLTCVVSLSLSVVGPVCVSKFWKKSAQQQPYIGVRLRVTRVTRT